MSSTNQTAKFHLPQWVATDPFCRTDFNAAFAAIDAAIPHIATGSYLGTGNYGSSNRNTLSFPFAPKFVMIRLSGADFYHGLTMFSPLTAATPDLTGDSFSDNDKVTAGWSQNGVSWYNAHDAARQMNDSGKTYYYFAIG